VNLDEAIRNSKGKIFYGMHFCPGVAQYDNADGSFKVFVNEATIRKMNPSFAGRPVFVDHVEEVDENINLLRNEADGWVVESFFNQADGKTWAKFIMVSERGFQAIRLGYRLSNAYIPMLDNTTGVWNGVTYQKNVIDGEFEHLAVVKSPRYDESVIMTPDEFKAYNENLNVELKRLANSNDKKGESKMKFFKRTKVENSAVDVSTLVELPLSKKEVTLERVINEYDKILNMNGYANGDHMVKVGEKDEMSVNDLVKKHMDMCNEMEKLKSAKGDEGGEPGKGEDEVGDLDVAKNAPIEDETSETKIDRPGDKSLDNEDDEAMENEDDESEEDKKKKMKNEAKAKAAALKNAHLNVRDEEPATIDLAEDQVARGKSRYGSN
jgi:hypothetical protein